MAVGGAQQQLERHFRIVVVGHHDRQAQPDALVGVAPVDDRTGDQALVRHQRFDTVTVAHHDIAATQFLHPAEVVGGGAGVLVEADDIARLDRFVHQQHEAADEVGGDVADAEAETEDDRAGEHGEGGEIDTGGVDAEQDAEADQKEIGGFADADAGGRRQRVDGHHPPFDGPRQQRHAEHEQRDHHQALDQRPKTEHRLAGQQIHLVERRLQPVKTADQLDADREPDEQGDAALRSVDPARVAEQ